jgi:predicted MFS family arabinose efflux permease
MIAINFFTTFIPVVMRQEKFSLSAIGLLHFLSLPLVLKFIWSPVIDRTCVTVNHYKRWIFISELTFAILMFAIAFFHFSTSFYLILVMVFISFAASTTQGIATDALATQVFDRKDKSTLNSMHLMGNFGGRLIGTGILLLIFKQIGWSNILFSLAFFAVIALIPLYFNRRLTIDRKSVV